MKVTIDGTEHEISESDLSLDDGYALITPDNVPKGYFNQEAVNKIVKENVNKTQDRLKSDLSEDEAFHKQILSKYNVQLGDDGKPKGLKPTVDIDEVKQNVTKDLSEKFDKELNSLKQELESRNKSVIKNSIMSTVKGKYQDSLVEAKGDKDPLIITHLMDDFTVDENGNAVVKDNENGGIKYKGDGKPLTADEYLLDEDSFGHFFADNRQRSTKTNPGGGSGRKYSEEEVKAMTDAEYEANRADILSSM